MDAIRLLNAGADDYLTKPFSAAHVTGPGGGGAAAHHSRAASPPISVVEIGPLRLDEGARSASLDGVPLTLTRKEYDVLAYLAARPGRVVTRKELFTEVWQQPFVGADQTLDVHLSWLRRKLGETAAQPRMLRTVRGVGVMLVPPGPAWRTRTLCRAGALAVTSMVALRLPRADRAGHQADRHGPGAGRRPGARRRAGPGSGRRNP